VRSEAEVNIAIERYADTVRRICMLHLKNYHDTEDIFQTVFMKYLCNDTQFESQEHEKAWIIRVAVNACKDLLKSFFRSRTVALDEAMYKGEELSAETSTVLQAVLALPEKYKDIVYLYFYEGYTAVEISKLTGKKVNTVYTLLTRAKQILKQQLGGEEFE